MSTTTTFATTTTVNPQWYHIDATDQVLGRLAVRLATVLMGKHKVEYTPHVDCGDYIVVTNVEGITLSGNKAEKKMHRYHTGYVGGLKAISYGRMMDEKPEEVLKLAIRRMLPKNKLGRHMLDKLKIYKGSEHPHTAQKPSELP